MQFRQTEIIVDDAGRSDDPSCMVYEAALQRGVWHAGVLACWRCLPISRAGNRRCSLLSLASLEAVSDRLRTQTVESMRMRLLSASEHDIAASRTKEPFLLSEHTLSRRLGAVANMRTITLTQMSTFASRGTGFAGTDNGQLHLERQLLPSCSAVSERR